MGTKTVVSNQPIVNIATGIYASPDMCKNVVMAKERGKEARKAFFQRIAPGTMGDSTQTSAVQEVVETEPSSASSSRRIPVHPTDKSTLKYADPIKRQKLIAFENMTPPSKRVSIQEDEGHSFASILARYDDEKLNLLYIMEWPITSKPWAICGERGTGRTAPKSLFRNNLHRGCHEGT